MVFLTRFSTCLASALLLAPAVAHAQKDCSFVDRLTRFLVSCSPPTSSNETIGRTEVSSTVRAVSIEAEVAKKENRQPFLPKDYAKQDLEFRVCWAYKNCLIEKPYYQELLRDIAASIVKPQQSVPAKDSVDEKKTSSPAAIKKPPVVSKKKSRSHRKSQEVRAYCPHGGGGEKSECISPTPGSLFLPDTARAQITFNQSYDRRKHTTVTTNNRVEQTATITESSPLRVCMKVRCYPPTKYGSDIRAYISVIEESD
jgi:hypothetical protein